MHLKLFRMIWPNWYLGIIVLPTLGPVSAERGDSVALHETKRTTYYLTERIMAAMAIDSESLP